MHANENIPRLKLPAISPRLLRRLPNDDGGVFRTRRYRRLTIPSFGHWGYKFRAWGLPPGVEEFLAGRASMWI